MGDKANQLQQILLQAVGLHNKDIIEIFICNVDSVDENAFTCNCTTLGGDAPISIPDIQLMAEVNDGVLYVPSINSTVVIALSTRNKAFVILFSTIDKYKIVIKNGPTWTNLDMQAGLTQFNDGSLGGLVKVIDLTTKLRNLELRLNAHENLYNTHTHPVVGAVAGITTMPETNFLTPTIQANIENTKITHGI